ALPALLHRARWEADDGPCRQPACGVDFDGDIVGLDTEDGGGMDGGEHGTQDGRDHQLAWHPAHARRINLLRAVRRMLSQFCKSGVRTAPGCARADRSWLVSTTKALKDNGKDSKDGDDRLDAGDGASPTRLARCVRR